MDRERMPRPLGEVVGAHRLVSVLGRGGAGCVYLGEHTVLGRKDAIKMLHAEGGGDPAYVERMFDEARAVSRLQHRHIVNVFDCGHDRGEPYLVFELLEGEDARKRLRRDGRMPLTAALEILAQIASALSAVHEAGLVHGDLKPENVFLTKHGVKLLDFGVAVAHEGGTPAYAAPEKFSDAALTPQQDIYAFGVLAFELLVGRLPYKGMSSAEYKHAHTSGAIPDPRSHVDMPAPLAALVTSCLDKTPSERPAMEDIETIIEQTRTFLSFKRPRPAKKSRRGAVISLATLALAGLGAALLWPRPAPAPPPVAVEVAPAVKAPAAETPPPSAAPAPVKVAAPTKKAAPKKKTKKHDGEGVIDAFDE